MDDLKNEIGMQCLSKHPNIVNLREAFVTKTEVLTCGVWLATVEHDIIDDGTQFFGGFGDIRANMCRTNRRVNSSSRQFNGITGCVLHAAGPSPTVGIGASARHSLLSSMVPCLTLHIFVLGKGRIGLRIIASSDFQTCWCVLLLRASIGAMFIMQQLCPFA